MTSVWIYLKFWFILHRCWNNLLAKVKFRFYTECLNHHDCILKLNPGFLFCLKYVIAGTLIGFITLSVLCCYLKNNFFYMKYENKLIVYCIHAYSSLTFITLRSKIQRKHVLILISLTINYNKIFFKTQLWLSNRCTIHIWNIKFFKAVYWKDRNNPTYNISFPSRASSS